MKRWHEMTDEEIANNPQALLDRARAYSSVLMGTPDGRSVFADILKIKDAERGTAIVNNTPHDASFYLGIDALAANILSRCGLGDNFAQQLSALLPVAVAWEPETKAPEDLTGVD